MFPDFTSSNVHLFFLSMQRKPYFLKIFSPHISNHQEFLVIFVIHPQKIIPSSSTNQTPPLFFLGGGCRLSRFNVPFLRRMELLGNVIVLASSLVCLAATGSGAWSEARSAIAVTQALSVCGLLNWTVRTIACLGIGMVTG